MLSLEANISFFSRQKSVLLPRIRVWLPSRSQTGILEKSQVTADWSDTISSSGVDRPNDFPGMQMSLSRFIIDGYLVFFGS